MSTTRTTSKKNATRTNTRKTAKKGVPATKNPNTAESPAPSTAVGSAGVPTHRTITEAKLWTALGNYPGFTSAELAGAAGIGSSTANRILAEWAADGYACTETNLDNPRAARTWSATDAYQDAASEPAPDTPPTPAAAPPSAPNPAEAANPAEPDTDAIAAPDEDTVTTTTDSAPAAETEPATATDEGGAEAQDTMASKLAPGQLRQQVEWYLAKHPGEEYTPHQIGKALNRSSGAVHNALMKLTEAEVARRTSDKPKKFALAEG
ncbi:MarR family transcriptional regulator [Nocardia terpenica]|uniref:hypothetical protein n=1 Tax=Nocardia terpenica TaxID=455432 RepID=UPI002FE36FDB